MNNIQNQPADLNNNAKRKNNILPFIVTLIGSVIIIIAFFLPYTSATDNYREYLENNPDEMYAEEINMQNENAIGISMIEYAKIFGYAATEMDDEWSQEVGIADLTVIVLIALFSLLTLLFSAIKKPVPTIIFNLLNFAAFRLLSWDFEDRGVIPNGNFDWSISYYIYHICALIIIAGSVWMLIAKRQAKKEARKIQIPTGNE